MKQGTNELQKLKGVGKVLAQRLVETGYDTFAKVAAAGEEGLKKISGINPRMVCAIVTQAGELAGEAEKNRAKRVEELKQRAASLKEQVQDIALGVRDRFKDELAGKVGKKVEKEIVKVVISLEKLEGKMENRLKKSWNGVAKAEKRLESLTSAGLKEVGKGLKKARKSLERVFA